MTKFLIFFILIINPFLFSDEFSLKNRFAKAEAGDYFVIAQNAFYTLLSIHESGKDRIILEEITMPESLLPKENFSWKRWVEENAPGHSSWIMYEIDLAKNELVECYSFSRGSHLSLDSTQFFLTTFLTLPLSSLPEDRQRRIGPPPLEGDVDHRPLWRPPVYIESVRTFLPLSVYHSIWPKDGSLLAGKEICLYLDSSFIFPFWIQVHAGHGSLIIRVIDTGKNLHSPHRQLPRRPFYFSGNMHKETSLISFTLQAPVYYENFHLFAVDVSEKNKPFHPIAQFRTKREGEQVRFEIATKDLQQQLTTGHYYVWHVHSVEYMPIAAQSIHPFRYQ